MQKCHKLLIFLIFSCTQRWKEMEVKLKEDQEKIPIYSYLYIYIALPS